jgi:NADH:ubiquinone oxidoreductase subunit 4 (subunit M)
MIGDAAGAEWGVIAALVAATLFLGIVPGPLLAATADAVASLAGGPR